MSEHSSLGIKHLAAFEGIVRSRLARDNPALADLWIIEAQRIIDALNGATVASTDVSSSGRKKDKG
jgi:hypothetical protein